MSTMQEQHQQFDSISFSNSRFRTPSTVSNNEVGPLGGTRTPIETCNAEEYVATSEDPTWPSGLRPYACLFGCFLLMFDSWGLVNAYGTFASYYSTDHLIGKNQILLNLIGSTQSFIVLLLAFVMGRLLDAHYGRYMIFIGATLISAGMFGLSGAKTNDYGGIWAAQGLTVGLGMSCFFVASSQIAATWFIKRKAVAIGIVACGASVAGVVYPIMTRFLLKELGFQKAVCAVAGLASGTSYLAWLLAVPNPHHLYRKPEDWLRFSVWVDLHAFKDAAFNWFTAGVCFVFFGFYAVFFNFEDWAASVGLGKKVTPDGTLMKGLDTALHTYWYLCIINGCSTIGRLSGATFAQRFGTVRVHALCTFVTSLLILILWRLTTGKASAIVFTVLFGALSGAVIGLPPASMAFILGTTPERQSKLGQWTGMMYTISSPFALTGPIIVGYLYGKYGVQSYVLQYWCGFCLLIGSFCMAMAEYHARKARKNESERTSRRGSRYWGSLSRLITREKGEADTNEKI